ncbi:hypothetical protein NDU88_004008 [Pleurodeles waltl]|uniref:XLR/SYCP3/FAM9 domain-containing protein n=1 Tax=Pleurodeles waltl TaxID=8319 RepID=A0AAV7SHK2_PLEWA|nr:hypothetical protein NDU88_004008 [Pleurodeles waltl]
MRCVIVLEDQQVEQARELPKPLLQKQYPHPGYSPGCEWERYHGLYDRPAPRYSRRVAVMIFVGDDSPNLNFLLSTTAADISKALLAKRKRLEMYTKASLKTSNQKIENVWKIQQEQRQKLNTEYSQQFLTLFQQWEMDVQKAEEQEEKITNMFRQQQKLFQQARIVQGQRLKTIKQLYEQFLKSMDDLEKSHESLLTGAQNELKKEMAMLQKKIMMDTVSI